MKPPEGKSYPRGATQPSRNALPKQHQSFMDKGMARRPFLSNPEAATFAWARYKRLMRFMLALTLGMVILGLTAVYRNFGMVSPHIFIATAAAIAFAMLLMAALMGLVFLSTSYQEFEDTQKEREAKAQALLEGKDAAAEGLRDVDDAASPAGVSDDSRPSVKP